MAQTCTTSSNNEIIMRVVTSSVGAGLLFFALCPGVLLTVGCDWGSIFSPPPLCPPTTLPCKRSYYVHTVVFAAVVAAVTWLAYTAAKSAKGQTKEE